MPALAIALFSAALLLSGQQAALADCKCRANGRLYGHGELACLRLTTGDQLARCDKVLNNPSWKKLRDGCPEAIVRDNGPKGHGGVIGLRPQADGPVAADG